ncbi:MAG: hypothetical protein HFJ59_08220 [Clostridia bacterium]|nr:hypothetical protein [Clostridia bacterium]
MFIFNLTDPITLILVTVATILFIFLSQEIKKSMVAVIPLFAFLILLVAHTIQIITLKEEFSYLYSILCYNMALDFVFLFVTFLGYLWADDVEAKALNKKVLNSKGINWLFKNV